jgi:hypothetical protein
MIDPRVIRRGASVPAPLQRPQKRDHPPRLPLRPLHVIPAKAGINLFPHHHSSIAEVAEDNLSGLL